MADTATQSSGIVGTHAHATPFSTAPASDSYLSKSF